MIRINYLSTLTTSDIITINLLTASRLNLELKWGYTIDGSIFGRIISRNGQTLHEQFYLGEDVMEQIAEVHSDFLIMLDSLAKTRRANTQRKWDERRSHRAHMAFTYREIPVINLKQKKQTSTFSLARLVTACFG